MISLHKKLCTKCCKYKGVCQFRRHVKTRDKLDSWCKLCHSKKTSEWKRLNRTKVAEYNKQYRILNKDSIAKTSSKYYTENKQSISLQRKNNPEVGRRGWAKRRAILAGVFIENVEREVLGRRDSWLCGLCKTSINVSLKYPDPMSASIDHRTPLSKGGEHSYANTQLAHLSCNKKKNAKEE